MHGHFKGILLDLDGTLVNTLYSLQDSMNKTMEVFHLDSISLDQTRKYVGNGYHKFVERSIAATADRLYREAKKWEERDEDKAFDLDQQADEVMECYDEACKEYKRIFSDNCTYRAEPYEGMKESLASLKNEGVQIACITNKSLDEAKKVLAASYGEGFFDYISADDGTHPLKPDTCVVEDTLNHLGLSLQEVVFVGDTKTDMETAKRAGIKAIGCLYGFRDKKELEKSGADVMIESAKDLIPAIDYLSEE